MYDEALNLLDSWTSPADSIWGAPSHLLEYGGDKIIIAFRRGNQKYVTDPIKYIPSILMINWKTWEILWVSDVPSYGFMQLNNSERLLYNNSSSFYVCGQNWSPKLDSPGSDLLGFVSCVDFSGDILWTRRFQVLDSQFNYHYLYDFKRTSDGGIVLVGETYDGSFNPIVPAQQAWILKVDSMGCLIPGCEISNNDLIPTIEDLDIRLFPNPINSGQPLSVFVNLQNHIDNLDFELVNSLGCTINTWKAHYAYPTTYILNLNLIPSGLYYFIVRVNNISYTHQLNIN